MFKVLKYSLIMINLLLISSVLALFVTTHKILDYYSDPKSVGEELSIIIRFSLLGIIGAVKESFSITLIYAIVWTLILIMCIIPTMSFHPIWLFLFVAFAIVCAYSYAAFIKIIKKEQQWATTSQVDNI